MYLPSTSLKSLQGVPSFRSVLSSCHQIHRQTFASLSEGIESLANDANDPLVRVVHNTTPDRVNLVEVVTAEGEPPLPLVAGGQVYPQQQAGLAHPSLKDCFRRGLEGGELVKVSLLCSALATGFSFDCWVFLSRGSCSG